MSKPRDIEIKLFGRTITSVLTLNHYDPSSFSPLHDGSDQTKEASSSSSSCSPSIGPDMVPDNKSEQQDSSRYKDPYILSDLNEPPKAASEISSPRSSKTQQSEITTSTSADKPTTLKKPDKILPCPRCESANTKFCYYNNYNVNQPRYLCRNCQRYWTAGGSMRNVPVGSGRRNSKGWTSLNHYLQVTSENFDNSNNNNSETILSFGSSESSVTETCMHQSGKTQHGFLPPQVMFPNNPSPWPYQWSPTNPTTKFYPIPFYWGYRLPLYPTSETSPSLGKRSRDQTEGENKDAKLPTKPEKKTEVFTFFNGYETKGSNRRSLVPETCLNLQVNPAAMSRSMNFRESMQQ